MPSESLLEINTRVWLKEQSWARGSASSPDLSRIPDDQLRAWTDLGLDWIWFMGVWDPSPRSREICLGHEGLMREFHEILPSGVPRAVVGSPYAIRSYTLNPALGDEGTLDRLREKMARFNLRLMLDFVPNHTATDHPWTLSHPKFYICGTERDLAERPGDFFRSASGAILAHGRDPYFPPWTDTAQINYANADAQATMIELLLELAKHCDGLRCDMAMLVTRGVFEKTWQQELNLGAPTEFWETAIPAIRCAHPNFRMMAEVYWDMESALQRMGFDYTYDKRLYDHLVHGDIVAAREHLRHCAPSFAARCARFIENHDEPRAEAAFGIRHRAAALISAALPGLMIHHEGQWDGKKIRLPVQLDERPHETENNELAWWYRRLTMAASREPFRNGECLVLPVREAWPGNPTHANILAIGRKSGAKNGDAHNHGDRFGLAVANLGPTQSQCYVDLPASELHGSSLNFRDLVNGTLYERSTAELREKGMFFDLTPGEGHLFIVESGGVHSTGT